jgi:methanesulfonate monooxygenase large subunit
MTLAITKPDLPDEYLVDNRVYTDGRTFEVERERIFLRLWNFVCHESEIPNPGDFRATVVAGQPIIVCRNLKGELRAFFNTCRHRAAQVVREDCGNARAFTCLYHLWAYDLDGGLISVPGVEAYKTSFNPCGLSKESFGLIPIRIESVHRLVFVCFDQDAPSLQSYLGSAADALVQPFGSPETKVWVMRKKVLKANWKMQPENSRDGYHAPLLHRRLFDVSPPKPYRLLDNGHAVQELGLDYEAGLKNRTVDKVLREDPELARAFMAHPLPGMTRERPSFVVVLFPDGLFLVRMSTLLIERQIPLNNEETLIEIRGGGCLSDTPEISEIRQKHWDLYWSEDGGNLPEDFMAWEAQQQGVKSLGARYSIMARGEPSATGLRGDDNRLRQFWVEWRRYMGTDRNAPVQA